MTNLSGTVIEVTGALLPGRITVGGVVFGTANLGRCQTTSTLPVAPALSSAVPMDAATPMPPAFGVPLASSRGPMGERNALPLRRRPLMN